MRRLLVIMTMALSIAATHQAQVPGIPGMQRAEPEVDLPKFDLDFPGGTPQELVDAIRAEIGKLNAIIPTEHAKVQLPPMKLQSVDAKQIFETLELVSMRRIPYVTGDYSADPSSASARRRIVSERSFAQGFRTYARQQITPDTVWYFFVEQPSELSEPKVVRYFQLNRFLGEFDVDDVTTAIQAGWKMLEEKDIPKLNFHEDTKMLIAVGQPAQLAMIDSVLMELDKALAGKPQTGLPVPASAGKTNETKRP